MYSPLLGNGTDDPDAWSLYLDSLPLTGKEDPSCRDASRSGFITGLCFRTPEGDCNLNDDVTIPCSPAMQLKMSSSTRKSIGVPTTADRAAFIYCNANRAFHIGGFVWMDGTTGASNAIQIDSLEDPENAKDK